MASSDTAQISTIIDLIQIINPSSILDVGCGWGKYGYLSREYLMGDYWDINHTIINAVEGYQRNINNVQKELYNEINICDALESEKYLKRIYDLIIIIDAFEHLKINDGIELIKRFKEHSKYLLISIPRYVSAQSGYSDDLIKFEEHRAFWTRKMFKSLSNCLIIPNNARKTIALYTTETKKIKSISKFCSKKLFFKFCPYVFADVFNFFKWFINRNNTKLFIERKNLDLH